MEIFNNYYFLEYSVIGDVMNYNIDNIYVGELVNTNRIYRWYHESKNKSEIISDSPWEVDKYIKLRNILFSLTKDNLSNDLLYDSPNYPILNISSYNTLSKLNNNLTIIKDATKLKILLEYFGYKNNLDESDIIKIKNTFFKPTFILDLSLLFGYIEVEDNNFDIKDIYTNRLFKNINKSILPKEYFLSLINLKDYKSNNIKYDTFKPKEHIKKLIKY